MSDDLFGTLFEQGKQKKKDKITEQKKSEKEKVKAEKAKEREKARKKAIGERSATNKKRKNNGEDINPKNKRQKTGSGNAIRSHYLNFIQKLSLKSSLPSLTEILSIVYIARIYKLIYRLSSKTNPLDRRRQPQKSIS